MAAMKKFWKPYRWRGSMKEISFSAEDIAQTQAVAAALARQCRPGDCVLLCGDLGSGKTTFARGFIQALQESPGEVVSPTFTLVQTYPTRDHNTVWHFDLYRLKHSSELMEIGLDEALRDGITLIEWPEIAQSQLPESALEVTIEMMDTTGHRHLSFSGSSEWEERLNNLKENT
jgi:tRNA threonylcarbamoyladenosine biosynthesis protein TsaE